MPCTVVSVLRPFRCWILMWILSSVPAGSKSSPLVASAKGSTEKQWNSFGYKKPVSHTQQDLKSKDELEVSQWKGAQIMNIWLWFMALIYTFTSDFLNKTWSQTYTLFDFWIRAFKSNLKRLTKRQHYLVKGTINMRFHSYFSFL